MSLEELPWLVDEWHDSREPFAFDEVAEVLHSTVHGLLLNAVGDGIVTIDHLTGLFTPTLDLSRRDTSEVLFRYLRWYVHEVSVSPSGLVAADRTILQGLRFRHVLTDSEARVERLDDGLDVAIPFEGLEPRPVAQGPLRRTYRDSVDGEESTERSAIAVIDGPAGWLAGAGPGDTIAVRWEGEELVVEVVDDGDPDAAIAAFRAALDVVDTSRPIDVFELVRVAALEAGGLGDDLGAPLTEVLAEAGWSQRGEELAPVDFDWEAHEAESRRRGRESIMARAGVAGPHMVEPIESLVSELFGRGFFHDDARAQPVNDGDVARVAGLLSEPGVAGSVFDLALGVEPTPDALDSVLALSRSLLDRAPHERRTGPARLGLLAADGAKRTDLLEELADIANLHAADDATLCSIAGDLALDRGRVEDARRHYFRGGVRLSDEVEQVLRGGVSPHRTGRNEACPCGSGQKYKRCHGDPRGRRLSDLERAQLLIVRLERHELRRKRLQRHRWHRAAGLVVDDEWLSDDASIYVPFLETLSWFEDGGLSEYLDERGSLLPDEDRRLAESWLGAPIVIAHHDGEKAVLSDGRVVEPEMELGGLGLMPPIVDHAIGRLVVLGDRSVFMRPAPIRAEHDAESILRDAGDDPEAIASALGSLRQRPQ